MYKYKLLSAAVLASVISMPVSADSIKFWTMEIQPERMAIQEKLAEGFEAATGHSVEVLSLIHISEPTRPY